MAALNLLAELPLEVVQGFIYGIEAGLEPISFDADRLATSGANNCRVVLNPSDFLIEVMSAAGALEGDRRVRE
jgi:hypothetical protein